MSVVRRDCR